MSVKTRIENNELSAGHARALLTSPNPERLAEVVLKEGLSVRATEKLAKTDTSISDPKDQERRTPFETRKKSLDPDPQSAQNQLDEVKNSLLSMLNYIKPDNSIKDLHEKSSFHSVGIICCVLYVGNPYII